MRSYSLFGLLNMRLIAFSVERSTKISGIENVEERERIRTWRKEG